MNTLNKVNVFNDGYHKSLLHCRIYMKRLREIEIKFRDYMLIEETTCNQEKKCVCFVIMKHILKTLHMDLRNVICQ